MRFSEHLRRTEKILGKHYREVHVWLDEFEKNYCNNDKYKHRKHRHHIEGIFEVIDLFGLEAGLAATIHVMDDNSGMIPKKEDYDIIEYRD